VVLVVAGLNYANLASAQATTRLKEIAMRRVAGASYRQVVLQSLPEALVLVMIAAGCALALMPLLSTLLSQRMGAQIGGLLFSIPSFWVTLAITIGAVTLLASSYPALVAARIRPADALHSGRTPPFKVRALRVLVVCQFATASFLFVATRILDAHNDLLLQATVTQGEDNIVVIGNDTRAVGLDPRLLQDELVSRPGIAGVSAIDLAPGELFGTSATISVNPEAGAKRKVVVAPIIDHGFFAALRIPVLAGRAFTRNVAGDVSGAGEFGNVVIDRTFARESGWTPQQALGAQVYVPVSAAPNAVTRARTNVGVVEDHTLYPAKLFQVMYANKPEPSLLPYVASLLLGLAVAWLVVLRKSLAAAGRPPAAVLRQE
jgi:putative ABC transport system permease protein